MHDTETLLRRVAELEQRLGVLEDIECIQRLQRMYGYYIDSRLWDEMTALFAGAAAMQARRAWVRSCATCSVKAAPD